MNWAIEQNADNNQRNLQDQQRWEPDFSINKMNKFDNQFMVWTDIWKAQKQRRSTKQNTKNMIDPTASEIIHRPDPPTSNVKIPAARTTRNEWSHEMEKSTHEIKDQRDEIIILNTNIIKGSSVNLYAK